jgi:hypothetical protein
MNEKLAAAGRRLLRPGTVLGLVAVMIAMTGSAYAGSLITSRQIKDGTITAKDIKNSSITTSKLSARTRDDLVGVPGATGPQGPAGPSGLAGIQAVESSHFSLAPGGYSPNVSAQCPPGKVVIGTGFDSSVAHTSFVKSYTYFVGGFIYNDSGITVTDLHFQAICASPTGAVASSAKPRRSAYDADRLHAIQRETERGR